MSQNISVGIMFDTEYIVQNTGEGGTCSSPKQVVSSDKCIYMVSDKKHEIKGHGSDALNIRAKRGDDIIWRTTALDFGSTYVPFLYEFVATQGGGNMDNIEVDSSHGAIAKPKTQHDGTTANCEMNLVQLKVGEITAKVKYEKRVTYHINFMLVKPTGPKEDNFEVVGYYYWDPHINWG